MLAEFKAFVARGSVFDLAVGIIIGAAFTSVVNSFVNDILMPPIGFLTGGVDFSELYINLSSQEYASRAEAAEAGAATINYGLFINSIFSFLIVAFAVFLLLRGYTRLRTEQEAAGPAEKACPFCLLNIPLAAVRCAHCTSELGREIA